MLRSPTWKSLTMAGAAAVILCRGFALRRSGLASAWRPVNDWHTGDGGLLARFSDGTVTDST